MTTNEVAKKWLEKLENPRRWERELEFNFGDDFLKLGYDIDVDDFIGIYGNRPLNSNIELEKVIDRINNVKMLGNAILGKWRYITHWAEDSVAKPEYVRWFKIALTRLEELTR